MAFRHPYNAHLKFYRNSKERVYSWWNYSEQTERFHRKEAILKVSQKKTQLILQNYKNSQAYSIVDLVIKIISLKQMN